MISFVKRPTELPQSSKEADDNRFEQIRQAAERHKKSDAASKRHRAPQAKKDRPV